jgi:hypothetical protein
MYLALIFAKIKNVKVWRYSILAQVEEIVILRVAGK